DDGSRAERPSGEHIGQFRTVLAPPLGGIQAHKKRDNSFFRCHAGRSLRSPTEATRRISFSCSASTASPCAVSLYGRRRPAEPRGEINFLSTNREIAVYRVPAPSETPAKVSMSVMMAYPCLAPDARLERINS